MDIKLNAIRIGTSAAGQPVAKSRGRTAGQENTALGQTDSLKAALDRIPVVRPEKVDAARAAVSNADFPSDEALKSVASLIADKIQ